MLSRIICIIFFTSFLCACSSVGLKPENASSIDYGDYPENYESIVELWFNDALKDPESAKYRFPSKPVKAYTRKAPITGGAPVQFGYFVKVYVNAKNSFGGYTGWKEYRLLIRNNQVVDRFIVNMYFDEPWYQ